MGKFIIDKEMRFKHHFILGVLFFYWLCLGGLFYVELEFSQRIYDTIIILSLSSFFTGFVTFGLVELIGKYSKYKNKINIALVLAATLVVGMFYRQINKNEREKFYKECNNDG